MIQLDDEEETRVKLTGSNFDQPYFCMILGNPEHILPSNSTYLKVPTAEGSYFFIDATLKYYHKIEENSLLVSVLSPPSVINNSFHMHL